MSNKTNNTVLDLRSEENRLKTLVSNILDDARQQGTDACEVSVNLDSGLSVGIRMGNVETIEFNRNQFFDITVYQGKKKGSASTSDIKIEPLKETLKAACNIASFASEDPYAGLAEAALMAKHFPDLDLYHPWEVDTEHIIELALNCEEAGRAFSNKIINSDSTNLATHEGCHIYGNSHGFVGSHISSLYNLSCVLIAEQSGEMQRDYWYSTARDSDDLESTNYVGKKAAMRTIARLRAQKISTSQLPVLFAAEVTSSFIAHFIEAISGNNLYRQASFLLDHLGQNIFPDWVQIYEKPHIKKALGSANFDNDGLITQEKNFISNGILNNYLLGTYSARKLGMKSTANAGGVNNLFLKSNAGDQKTLMKEMGTGLLVTELMGQGVNTVTGDYSRGACGFLIENGEIKYPVSEVTISGNLKDMFMNIIAAGNDYDRRGNIQSGSILISEMTVAGE